MNSNNIKNITKKAAPYFPLNFLRGLAPKVPLHLFYHIVSDKPVPYISAYQIKSSRQFEADLDSILKYYQPVDLRDITHRKFSKRVFHLSFDDGLRECSEVIAPILLRKGIPATFFINNGFVDNKALFHKYLVAQLKLVGIIQPDEKFDFNSRHLLAERISSMNFDLEKYLTDHSPYMTLDQIQRLNLQGFTIGAHSVSHPEFWKISIEEQFQQIKQSVDWVTEFIRPDLKVFAFPFTDDGVQHELFKKLYDEQIVDFTFGTAGYKPDQFPTHFQRIPIEQPQATPAINLIKHEYLYATIRASSGVNMVKRS